MRLMSNFLTSFFCKRLSRPLALHTLWGGGIDPVSDPSSPPVIQTGSEVDASWDVFVCSRQPPSPGAPGSLVVSLQ